FIIEYCPEDISDCLVYILHIYPAFLESLGQFIVIMLDTGHLDIHAVFDSLYRVLYGPEEIGDSKAFKSPFVPQYVLQQQFALRGLVPQYLVVGAHHGCGPFLDTALEMRQVYFVQRSFVYLDVSLETGILNAVQGKVLDAG